MSCVQNIHGKCRKNRASKIHLRNFMESKYYEKIFMTFKFLSQNNLNLNSLFSTNFWRPLICILYVHIYQKFVSFWSISLPIFSGIFLVIIIIGIFILFCNNKHNTQVCGKPLWPLTVQLCLKNWWVINNV